MPTRPASVAPQLRLFDAPAEFRHPEAQREICLAGVVIAYALKRRRRRSIGFVVGREGLSVSAPRWVGVGAIEAALHAKADWICTKLMEQRERAERRHAARIDWRDGTTFPYLGEPVILVLDPRAATAPSGAVLNTDGDALPGVPCTTLHLGVPQAATPAQIRDALQRFLRAEALRVFAERCAHFAPRLGVRCTRLSLSSAQTRWGSANGSGAIRLNWRLVHLPLASIDYVVVHELAHLREMNHGPRFWAAVREVLPDYEAARASLKGDVLPPFE